MTFEKKQYEHSSLRGFQKTWHKSLISWNPMIYLIKLLQKSGRYVEINPEVGGKAEGIFGSLIVGI